MTKYIILFCCVLFSCVESVGDNEIITWVDSYDTIDGKCIVLNAYSGNGIQSIQERYISNVNGSHINVDTVFSWSLPITPKRTRTICISYQDDISLIDLRWVVTDHANRSVIETFYEIR